ncbi:MAG: hypothetical protein K1X79_04220 [Oligoflexia bacterium]|nr:hypothetical protein [Oligoflexia bacterium]
MTKRILAKLFLLSACLGAPLSAFADCQALSGLEQLRDSINQHIPQFQGQDESARIQAAQELSDSVNQLLSEEACGAESRARAEALASNIAEFLRNAVKI